jgi:WD40 repeat protein
VPAPTARPQTDDNEYEDEDDIEETQPDADEDSDSIDVTRSSFMRRLISDIVGGPRAAVKHVDWLSRYLQRRRKLRSRRRVAEEALIALGEKLAAKDQGDKVLRSELADVDDQLTKASTRRLKQARRDLLLRLGAAATEQDEPPPGCKAVYKKARKAEARFVQVDEALDEARAGLFLKNPGTRRRTIFGYLTFLLMLAGSIGLAVLLDTLGPRVETTTLNLEPSFRFHLAFSPDLKTVATAGPDNAVLLWDVQKGEVRATLKGHRQPVQALAFSPNGKLLATAGDDNTVRLWDLATNESKAPLTAHVAAILFVEFAPTGDVLASGAADGTIKLWDVEQGSERTTLSGYGKGPLAFSPDGALLAAGGARLNNENASKGVVKIWDVKSGAEKGAIKSYPQEVYSVCFSPNGKLLAAGSLESIKLFDVGTLKEQSALTPGSKVTVGCLAFSPNGSMLAAGGSNKAVTLWDTSTNERRATLQGHIKGVQGKIVAMRFSSGGRTLASASGDGTLVRWNRIWDFHEVEDATVPGSGTEPKEAD